MGLASTIRFMLEHHMSCITGYQLIRSTVIFDCQVAMPTINSIVLQLKCISAVLASCCTNCVETSLTQQWEPGLPFLGKPAMQIRGMAGAAPHKGG